MTIPKVRIRVKKPKTKTGCKTCRIRRVKCDEAKPACRRCTSTGRKCDGYDTPSLTHKASSQILAQTATRCDRKQTVSITYTPTIALDLASGEAQGFVFFRENTVFEIQGAFRSNLWEQLVLQVCHQEPAVLHAAIAVGIVHRDQSDTQVARQNAFYHGLDKRQANGLRQYVKAIEFLRQRIDDVREPGDERANDVAMMCCLLFVCLELLWGKSMTALNHLDTGLKILTSRVSQTLGHKNTLKLKPTSENLVDQLSASFTRLDFESTMFGQRAPHLHVTSSGVIDQKLHVPSKFESILEARRYMDMLSNGMLRFRGKLLEIGSQCTPAIPLELLFRYLWDHASTRSINFEDHPLLLCELGELGESLSVWSSAFDELKNRPRVQLDHMRSLILLELQHFYAYLLLSTCQTTKEVLCDNFNELFQRVVQLSKQYLDLQSTKSRATPVFALDSGIIPALYLTAYKCRCPRIRREAISLMIKAPCQEGMWDGKMIAKFMTKVVELEERRAGKFVLESSDVGEVARCSDILVLFHSERIGWGRLICARYRHESDGELVIWEEQFKLLDE
ncbi:hypothetical protein ONS95_005904 [Cadophora gregata]|uniref:uncharacterized protein n=1 Tax=Cadophora gregata TaxID=51156 RepID=UPI0026DD9C1D|nr:uncharacterized protein ONS95_005904 [Cadophora gregata]KAK0102282.1 hypothetical protein ONS95_005904 [Cadophora gregata]